MNESIDELIERMESTAKVALRSPLVGGSAYSQASKPANVLRILDELRVTRRALEIMNADYHTGSVMALEKARDEREKEQG